MYADYEYYVDVYFGKAISEAEYGGYAQRAAAYLDWLTNDSIDENNLSERTKNAACAVADTLLLNENGGGIASQSVGKWSVNYVAGVSKAKTDEQRLYEAASLYLGNTGLLNRWC